jgi:hypothetical protein
MSYVILLYRRGGCSLKMERRLVKAKKILSGSARSLLAYLMISIGVAGDVLAYFLAGLILSAVFSKGLHTYFFPDFSLRFVWFVSAVFVGFAIWSIQPGSGRKIAFAIRYGRNLFLSLKGRVKAA